MSTGSERGRQKRIEATFRSLIAAGVAALLPLTAAAATITVDTKADNMTAGDGECTLREAIGNVNALGDASTGDCAAGTGAGDTIAFDLELPAKIKLTLGQLVVGQDVSIVGPTTGSLRISGSRAGRVLSVTAGTTSVSNLTIERGRDLSGGGISNAGTLILSNCTLKANSAGLGGGISNAGTATLINCTLKGNKGGQGGGINNAGTLHVTNSTFKGNRGYYGVGGGILNIGTATFTNCTLNRNRAYAGKGSLGGGGIWHSSANLGTATLTNTIVATSGRGGDCAGDPVTSNGHNLSSDDTCFTGGGTDLVETDPLLAPLANYGGPTETQALCSGPGVPKGVCSGPSPALDAGDDAVTGPPDNLTTDQRGLNRNAGLHVDIGAYERQ